MFDNDGVLTAEDVMDILHIGKNTVYRLLNSGEIPSFKIGKIHKIPRKPFDEWLTRRSECRLDKLAAN